MIKLQFAIFESLVAASLIVFATAFIANITYQYSTEFNSRQLTGMNFIYDFATALEKNQSLMHCIEIGCKNANVIVKNFAEVYKINTAKLSINGHSYAYSCKFCFSIKCDTETFCFPVTYNKSYNIACISECGIGG
jgi:hypothetical protein